MKKISIFVCLLVLLLGCTQIEEEEEQSVSYQSLVRGTTEQGDVAIEISPKGMEEGQFIVGLVANTHSVDMSQFDAKRAVTLHTAGQTYKPVSAPILRGHHVYGSMAFDIPSAPQAFIITIDEIPKEQREYVWE